MADFTSIVTKLVSIQAQLEAAELTSLQEQLEEVLDELGQLSYKLSETVSQPVDNVVPPLLVEGVPDVQEVIGGERTNDFPDCCAVGSSVEYTCSGTLIAPNVVVTADHCDDTTRVFLKGSNVDHPDEGETIQVIKLFSHPEVDLKVLVLEQDSQVTPRHVAQGAEVQTVDTAVVAGFGTIDAYGRVGYGIKRRAEVPMMSLQCLDPTDPKKFGCQSGREIVAGHVGLKRDTCQGDSGGPLYVVGPDGDYYLLGATSRGAGNAHVPCGDGGIYVRVDLCLDWIREVTGVDIEGPREA